MVFSNYGFYSGLGELKKINFVDLKNFFFSFFKNPLPPLEIVRSALGYHSDSSEFAAEDAWIELGSFLHRAELTFLQEKAKSCKYMKKNA